MQAGKTGGDEVAGWHVLTRKGGLLFLIGWSLENAFTACAYGRGVSGVFKQDLLGPETPT